MNNKKYMTPNDVYRKCLQIQYAQFSTQGNNPNISNAERISQILASGSLGGKVQIIRNGINGQREGQPGGVIPPLRNKF